MKILIAERLHPFSHFSGIFCLLPGSFLRLQIFPALIRVHDLSKAEPQLIQEIPVAIKGPVKQFTVMNDLERGWISVWGHTPLGFFRYRIHSTSTGCDLSIIEEKSPQGQLLFDFKPDRLEEVYQPVLTNRLSLGNQKAQEWELVEKRSDLSEIFPLWNRLGQLLPQMSNLKHEGTSILLDTCEQAIASNAPETILPTFLNLFKAGFSGILTPRLIDDQYQGISSLAPIHNLNLSPLILLTEGAKLIRSLFVQQNDLDVNILPALPPEFHSGRFLNIKLETLGMIDLEWNKKLIRRVMFNSHQEGDAIFHFRHIKTFRVKMGDSDKGYEWQSGKALPVVKNTSYFFDNFE